MPLQYDFNFVTFEEKLHVKTGADGSFRFTDNPSHKIELSAETIRTMLQSTRVFTFTQLC